jgi:hypothetical protein
MTISLAPELSAALENKQKEESRFALVTGLTHRLIPM